MTYRDRMAESKKTLRKFVRLEKHYRVVWGMSYRDAFLIAWETARKERT